MDWSKIFTVACGVTGIANMCSAIYYLLKHEDYQKATFHAVIATLLVK